MTVVNWIASKLQAAENCRNDSTDKYNAHISDIEHFLRVHAPHGSGIDSDVRIDLSKSRENRIVLDVSFHHMNIDGYYTCWSDHQVVVTPSLVHGFNIRVTGKNINDIKEYLSDVFQYFLAQDYNTSSY